MYNPPFTYTTKNMIPYSRFHFYKWNRMGDFVYYLKKKQENREK
jgi:hypothetical protein